MHKCRTKLASYFELWFVKIDGIGRMESQETWDRDWDDGYSYQLGIGEFYVKRASKSRPIRQCPEQL